MGPQINVDYICGTYKDILISYNALNILAAVLLLTFLFVAIWRKVHWIIIVLVSIILAAGIYFTSFNIQPKKGCSSSFAQKFELYPSWWRE